MSLHRKYRVLVVGESTYLWQVKHRHRTECEEILSIRRVGAPSRRTLYFRPRPGFAIPVGGWGSEAGVIYDDEHRCLNLNEPGTVRVFVDILAESEWPAADRRAVELDGWLWFGEAWRRRALKVGAAASSGAVAVVRSTAS